MKDNMKLAVVVVVILLVGGILLSLYIAPSEFDITSQEDLSKAITNVSSNVEDIASILDDIDKGLG